jgi:iron complex transport system permease protein
MKLVPTKWLTPLLVVLLLLAVLLASGIGAVHITPLQSLAIFGQALGLPAASDFSQQQEAVLLHIRMPRVVLALLIGAVLAMSGAAMQGLFRNPLADPGLIGVSSGASVTAVFTIVLAASWFPNLPALGSSYVISLVTFIGAFVTTLIVYRLSQVNGKTLITTMLLAGVAINGLTGALTGLMTYATTESQLRSITFWMLGSLGGASWNNVLVAMPFMVLPLVLLPRRAHVLNILALGEANATYLGIPIERVKRGIILLVALGVGASVAIAGIIAFVGLVVPHIIRLVTGPDNRLVLINSALAGGLLLVGGDLVARTIFAPAELPIGIITSLIGSPVFLYLLLKDRKTQKLV